jgi:C4-dicarboxylate-specific signal transduction histidine kinase
VLVRERARELRIFHQGQLVVTLQKRPRSQEIVLHPDQFQQVAPVASLRQAAKPLAHQVDAPLVATRELREYDQLFGLEGQP